MTGLWQVSGRSELSWDEAVVEGLACGVPVIAREGSAGVYTEAVG